MKRVIYTVFLVVLILSLTACRSREAISVTEFTSRMEEAGHSVSDQSHYFDDDPYVSTFLIADCGTFEVEFIVFGTAERARLVHTITRQEFEETSEGSSARSEVNTSNFNRFRQINAGQFQIVSRIANTVVAVVTSSDNQAEVNAVLDILGY